MTERKQYAYRLVVTYPEGVGWANPPQAWKGDLDDDLAYNSDPEADNGFHWPRVRPYLSRSGAKARADLLVRYGCTVTIERSDPITWPGAVPLEVDPVVEVETPRIVDLNGCAGASLAAARKGTR